VINKRSGGVLMNRFFVYFFGQFVEREREKFTKIPW
jgi:hypothetical protein